MNYDKLSRALRYYYDKNIMTKVRQEIDGPLTAIGIFPDTTMDFNNIETY